MYNQCHYIALLSHMMRWVNREHGKTDYSLLFCRRFRPFNHLKYANCLLNKHSVISFSESVYKKIYAFRPYIMLPNVNIWIFFFITNNWFVIVDKTSKIQFSCTFTKKHKKDAAINHWSCQYIMFNLVHSIAFRQNLFVFLAIPAMTNGILVVQITTAVPVWIAQFRKKNKHSGVYEFSLSSNYFFLLRATSTAR